MLNRCPSCKASVLDDDAVTCPFCGSPMNAAQAKNYKPAGGGTAPAPTKATPVKGAPAKAAPTKPTTTGPAPGAKPPGRPAATAGLAADDDPFAIDPTAGSSAVPLSPKRTQSRPHPVKCPMCDTVGYAPESASGKEVRCANAKCMVPIFTAPDYAAPKPVEPEPEPSVFASPTLWTFLAVVLILVGGGSVWYFVLRKETPATPVDVPIANNDTPGNGLETPTPPPEDVPPPPPAGPTPGAVFAATLTGFPDVAQDASQPLRKPLRRRFAAEAFALAGQPAAAREQLQRLTALPDDDPFYQIPPLTDLAWNALRQGDEPLARQTVAETLPLANSIPRQGFDPGRIAIAWAAAVARFGDVTAARNLLAAGADDDGAVDQSLADLRAAALFHAYNLDAELSDRPLRDRVQPKATATVFELFRHTAPQAARTLIAAATDSAVRADYYAAFAEATAAGPGTSDAKSAAVTDLLQDAEPAVQVYVLARAAVRMSGRDAAAATTFLNRAIAAAEALPQPEPVGTLTLEDVYRRELPDRAAVRLRSAALAEAARAATRLDQNERAWTLVTAALEQLRAAGPSPAAIAQRSNEYNSLGITGLRGEMQRLLKLSDDEARLAANEYRRKLRDAEAAATERFDLQSDLLTDAVGWGLGDRVLAEAKTRQAASDPATREAYLTGPAGGRLLAAFLAAGNKPAADELLAAGVGENDIPAAASVEAGAAAFMEAKDPVSAARAIFAGRGSTLPRGARTALALRLTSRAAATPPAAFAFAKAIPDEAVREEALRLLAAQLAAAGKAPEADRLARGLQLVPTEKAAVGLGLVEGLVAAGVAPTP